MCSIMRERWGLWHYIKGIWQLLNMIKNGWKMDFLSVLFPCLWRKKFLFRENSKDFCYLYDEENACYRLAPAYDLTYSNSLNGEHATTINGNGLSPNMQDILAVADKIGIKKAQAQKIANDIKTCVYDML